MNRNTEWEAYVKEIKESLPPKIEYSAQRAVQRGKHQKMALLVKIPAVSVCTTLVLFVALANTSEGFSNAMKKVPLLKKATKFVTANPALRQSLSI
jgi:hypothetical protein